MESDPSPPSPVGNHRLATQIAYDSTLSIYRSFTVLNTRNLLYLQTELASLEDRLLRLDNRANDLNEWSLPRSWRAMRNKNGEMWTTAMEVRKLLEMYSKFLLITPLIAHADLFFFRVFGKTKRYRRKPGFTLLSVPLPVHEMLLPKLSPRSPPPIWTENILPLTTKT